MRTVLGDTRWITALDMENNITARISLLGFGKHCMVYMGRASKMMFDIQVTTPSE